MRFEGLFSKGKPDVLMEILCKQCYLQQMLPGVYLLDRVGMEWREIPGFSLKLPWSCAQSLRDVLQWVMRPVLCKKYVPRTTGGARIPLETR